MLRLLIAFAFLVAAPAGAAAQTRPTGAEYWTETGERMTLTAARIGFPKRAGAALFRRSVAFGERSEGMNNALFYASADEEVIATAYIYYPGLPHAGLAAIGTDYAMRARSGGGLRLLARRVAAGGGGREGVAIRDDFAGLGDEREASSAAFVKVGRWLVKLRVTGPEARRAEVERTMTALLDGLSFEGGTAPRAAEPITLGDCPQAGAAGGRAAVLLAPNAAEAMEDAITGLMDGVGDNGREPAAEHRAGTPVVGRNWCVSSLRGPADALMPILRADPAPDAPAGHRRRSLLIAIISDSGATLEVVETHFRNRTRFALLHHRIGQTRVLGSYDALPTDAQITAILSDADRAGGAARATILHRPDGNSEVTLHVAPDRAAAPVP
jgi:hypothetical protein